MANLYQDNDTSFLGASLYLTPEGKNIPFYKNNTFQNSLDAERYIIGNEFQSFWNRGNLPDEQIGLRVKTSANALDAMEGKILTHGKRDYKSLIDKRQLITEKSKANFKPNPNLFRSDGIAKGQRIPVSIEEQIARHSSNMDNGLAQVKNMSRIENRFFTSLKDVRGNAGVEWRGLNAYMGYAQDFQKSGHSGAGEGRLPITMVADKNLQRWSLKDFEPFDGVNGGLKDGDFMNQMRAIENSGEKIGERYGLKLGARISSNPQHEIFAPSSVGQSAKRVGNINPDQSITVAGPASKYSQLAAKGQQAFHVGGKALAVIGGALEVANVPDRVKGYYMNALKNDPNWRPDASDKFGMSLFAGLESSANFATMGFYDQRERIARDATSGAGYGKGYYGTMIPRSGMTSVHQNPESRYDRQGVSFNHLYPKAP